MKIQKFKVKNHIQLDSGKEKISEFAVTTLENIQNEKQTPTLLKMKCIQSRETIQAELYY